MTEDTSPENLRKFLESDDSAMIRMGLSMAKGAEVSDEILEEILWMYLFHDDKTIRAAARSTFMKLAPEDVKLAVKKNWKANYRTIESSLENNLYNLEKGLSQTSVSLARQLIKDLDIQLVDDDKAYRRHNVELNQKDARVAAGALGAIGDERAVEPLIKTLGEGNSYAAWALGEMGDARAVEPLIKALEDESEKVRVEAANSLGEIRDERAVEPLIKALEDKNSNVRRYAVAALDALGWEPDMEQFQLVRLLALSGLRFSDLPNEAQEGLVEHCKLLLSHGKILNLAQEEFAKIVKERNSSLETMENPCTAEELIELLAGVSSQTRWIVACGVVEISFYNGATMDKIWRDVHRNRPINLFSRISAYSNLITKADLDEILRGMKGLPPVLVVHIAKRLTNFAIDSLKDKEASATVKKNRKMITAISEDLDLAKIILGKT